MSLSSDLKSNCWTRAAALRVNRLETVLQGQAAAAILCELSFQLVLIWQDWKLNIPLYSPVMTPTYSKQLLPDNWMLRPGCQENVWRVWDEIFWGSTEIFSYFGINGAVWPCLIAGDFNQLTQRQGSSRTGCWSRAVPLDNALVLISCWSAMLILTRTSVRCPLLQMMLPAQDKDVSNSIIDSVHCHSWFLETQRTLLNIARHKTNLHWVLCDWQRKIGPH